MGEALISTGDVERGVEHLANAVIVCGQPTQLLQVKKIQTKLKPLQISFLTIFNFIIAGTSTNPASSSVQFTYSTNETIRQSSIVCR